MWLLFLHDWLFFHDWLFLHWLIDWLIDCCCLHLIVVLRLIEWLLLCSFYIDCLIDCCFFTFVVFYIWLIDWLLNVILIDRSIDCCNVVFAFINCFNVGFTCDRCLHIIDWLLSICCFHILIDCFNVLFFKQHLVVLKNPFGVDGEERLRDAAQRNISVTLELWKRCVCVCVCVWKKFEASTNLDQELLHSFVHSVAFVRYVVDCFKFVLNLKDSVKVEAFYRPLLSWFDKTTAQKFASINWGIGFINFELLLNHDTHLMSIKHEQL
jgi:hypothetical protein